MDRITQVIHRLNTNCTKQYKKHILDGQNKTGDTKVQNQLERTELKAPPRLNDRPTHVTKR